MKKGTKTEFFRKCPECDELVYYVNKYSSRNAEKEKSLCVICAQRQAGLTRGHKISSGQTLSWNKRKRTLKYKAKKLTKMIVKLSKKEQYFKYCPQCGTEQYYKQKDSLDRAVRDNSLCRNCGAIKAARKQGRIIWSETELKRNCPKCNKILYYANRISCYSATQNNSLCAKCCNKGRKATEETIKNLSESHMGFKQSKKSKKKKSESMKKVWEGQEYREKRHKSLVEAWAGPDIKKKWMKSLTGTKKTDKEKRAIRKRTKALWTDPEFVKKQMKACHVKQNKQEFKLEEILNKLTPNEYKFVGDGGFILGGKIPDFLNVNGQKKLIELYGDYWHDPDVFPGRQTPKQRIKYFKKYGFNTLVIWEKELKDEELLKQKIIKFNEER